MAPGHLATLTSAWLSSCPLPRGGPMTPRCSRCPWPSVFMVIGKECPHLMTRVLRTLAELGTHAWLNHCVQGNRLSPMGDLAWVMATSSIKLLVTQSCLTLCNPMDYSLPGFSVHGDSPDKNIGVCCHALLRGSSKSRDRTHVSHITGGFFTIWAIN